MIDQANTISEFFIVLHFTAGHKYLIKSQLISEWLSDVLNFP